MVKLDDPLPTIFSDALAAPTGDNSQPFLFRPRAGGFDVLFEQARFEAFLDVEMHASWMSLGALLENARLSARHLGFDLEWKLAPEPGNSALLARVTLSRANAEEDPLHREIHRRHTNRVTFDGRPLDQHQRRLLACEPGARVIDEPDALAELADVAGDVEAVRAATREAHECLHRWLRWSPDQAERTCDGLDVRTLGITTSQRAALRVLRPWSLMRAGVALGAEKMQGEYTRKLVASASALVAIFAADVMPPSMIEAGRVMQRVWLRATGAGIAISPVASIPLLTFKARIDPGAFAEPLTRKLLDAHARASRIVSPDGAHLAFLMRVGFAAPPAVRALRRPLCEVVVA